MRARLVAWFSGSGAQLAAATSLVIGWRFITPLAATPSGTAATSTASPASVTFASATTEPSSTALRSALDQPASEPDARQLPRGQQDTAVASGNPPPESASVDATSGTAAPSLRTPLETARSAALPDVAPPIIKALTAPSLPIPQVTVPPVTVPPVTVPPVTVPPVTVPPVTVPPVTAPPVTAPPVTAPPVTAPPVTAPPVTAPPVTAPPVTVPPVTSVSAPADPLPDIPALGD